MADRHFPVRPNLEQLRHQAKDLLRAIRRGEPAAVAELQKHHPKSPDAAVAKLADAQLALARSYGLSSWPRLFIACRLTDAIWRDDVDGLRELLTAHPELVHEDARGVARCNWGPPMSYAANLGRDRIIDLLRERGAADLQHAFDRACLQGRLETARRLFAMGARPARDSVMGPAETQSGAGLRLLLEMGAEIRDGHGDRLAPVAMVLETYCRNPKGKHECLELFAAHGIALPDTPVMALHRGRIERGADVNARAAVDADGFGGHTALFGCVVSQPFRVGLRSDDAFARLLLDHGADPNARAALRKRLRFLPDETLHEYRDVTPVAWGRRFHDRDWVSNTVLALLAERGGRE